MLRVTTAGVRCVSRLSPRLTVVSLSLSLGRVYEEHVLTNGSLDERIFTGEGASEDIGTPGPCLCEGVNSQDSATFRLHSSLAVRWTGFSPPGPCSFSV